MLPRVGTAEGNEDGGAALPDHTKPAHQLFPGGVVGHEEIVTLHGQGEVPIPHVEGDTYGFVPAPRRHGEDRLEGPQAAGSRRWGWSNRSLQRAFSPRPVELMTAVTHANRGLVAGPCR